jgi:lysozyme
MARSAIAVRVVAAAVAAASLFAIKFEGDRHTAFLDPVGKPTICYGHTDGVKLGQTASHDQCLALLSTDMREAATAVLDASTVPLTVNELTAYSDFVYNAGPTQFRSSTMLSKLNAGDHAGACKELLRWVYGTVKGKKVVLPGLVTRRQAEYKVCMS